MQSLPYLIVTEKNLGAVSRVLKEQRKLAVDCEGVNLGKDGKLTLVQVAAQEPGTVRRNSKVEAEPVYLFDILTCGKKVVAVLKDLLEDGNVLKVLHDCRNDSIALRMEVRS